MSALNDGNSNGYNNDDETLLIYVGEWSDDSAHCVDTRSNGQWTQEKCFIIQETVKAESLKLKQ